MKEIPLTQGKVALVDDEDYARLMQFKWFVVHNGKKWYASRKLEGLKRKNKFLHREILGEIHAPLVVDHIDGDGLNCAKENMRICTQAENSRNSRSKCNGKVKYKGVCWHKASSSYVAQINTGGKVIHLGCFDSPEEAAVAYDNAASHYYGEYAFLNNVTGFTGAKRPLKKPNGSKMPAAKLTEALIPGIRASKLTHTKLAEIHGVSRGLISMIKRGAIWQHVN